MKENVFLFKRYRLKYLGVYCSDVTYTQMV